MKLESGRVVTKQHFLAELGKMHSILAEQYSNAEDVREMALSYGTRAGKRTAEDFVELKSYLRDVLDILMDNILSVGEE